MGFFPSSPLAEAIVFELRQGPRDTNVLIHALHQHGHRATKQGIYKALRQLRAQEVVFLQQGEASLSLRWLECLERFVSLTQHAYASPVSGSGSFLSLEEGERITYSFKNPVLLDAFWNHVLYLLYESVPELDRWYAYASHCWFMLARPKEEQALYRFLNKRGVRVLYTVAHKTPLDRFVAKEFDGDKMQYHMMERSPFIARRNYHGLVINIVGDFVVETQYDKHITERIERFYQNNRTLDDKGIRELEEIVSTPARTKLLITKNSAKARKLRNLFGRYFYLSPQKESC